MSWKSYRQAGGSSGFRARGSFRNAKVTGGTYYQEEEEPKNIVIIGVGKDEKGRVVTENIGKNLSQEQREEVSKATSEEGRLKATKEEKASAKEITQAFRRRAEEKQRIRQEEARKEGRYIPSRQEGRTQREFYAGQAQPKTEYAFYSQRTGEPAGTNENPFPLLQAMTGAEYGVSEARQDPITGQWYIIEYKKPEAQYSFFEQEKTYSESTQKWISEGYQISEWQDLAEQRKEQARTFWAGQPVLQGPQSFNILGASLPTPEAIIVETLTTPPLNPVSFAYDVGITGRKFVWVMEAPFVGTPEAQKELQWTQGQFFSAIAEAHHPRSASGVLNLIFSASMISELSLAWKRTTRPQTIEYEVMGKNKSIEVPKMAVERGSTSVTTNYIREMSTESSRIRVLAWEKNEAFVADVTQDVIVSLGQEKNPYFIQQKAVVYKQKSEFVVEDLNKPGGWQTSLEKIGESEFLGTGIQTGSSVNTRGFETTITDQRRSFERRFYTAKNREIESGDWPMQEQLGFSGRIETQPGLTKERSVLGIVDVKEPSIIITSKKGYLGLYNQMTDTITLPFMSDEGLANTGFKGSYEQVASHEAGHRTTMMDMGLRNEMLGRTNFQAYNKEWLQIAAEYKRRGYKQYEVKEEILADSFSYASAGKNPFGNAGEGISKAASDYLQKRARAKEQIALLEPGPIDLPVLEDVTVQRSKMLATVEVSPTTEVSFFRRAGIKTESGKVEEITPSELFATKEEIPEAPHLTSSGLATKQTQKYKEASLLMPAEASVMKVINLATTQKSIMDLRTVQEPVVRPAPKQVVQLSPPLFQVSPQGSIISKSTSKEETLLIMKPESLTKEKTTTDLRLKLETQPKQEAISLSKELTKTQPKTLTRGITKELTKEIEKAIPKEITKEITKQTTKTQTKEITKQQTKQQAKSLLQPIPLPRDPTPHRILPPIQLGQDLSNRGWDVLIRTAGIFQKANPQTLTKEEALQFGMARVEKTSAASFKLIPSSGPPAARFQERRSLADFFKGSKTLGSDVYIEKPSRRINTPGELFQITFKGWMARKK